MKKINFLFVLAFSLLTFACSTSDDPVPEPKPEPQPEVPETPDNLKVSFNASISPISRASDTQFDNGDQIGVFAVKANGGSGAIQPSNNYASNVIYTYDGSRFTSNSPIEIPDDKTQYYYHAIYPYLSSANASFRFSVKTDQRGSDYTLSDLCTAHTSATSENLVNLKFAHRYSKIIIKLIGDNWPSYSDAKLTLKSVRTEAKVDLNSMEITTMPTFSSVVCADNGTRSFKVIVPPQVLKETDSFASLVIGGTTYNCNLGVDRTLESGKQLVIEYEKAPDGKLVEFTGNIDPWDNTDERIDHILPPSVRDKIKGYLPIYEGSTPPMIEGTYFMDPYETVYCDDGNFKPGDVISSYYYKFFNQDKKTNTLDYRSTAATPGNDEKAVGAIISGYGNYFTAMFATVGISEGIDTKTVAVVSGIKTASGIKDMRYAFIMVEKGPDPNHKLMDVNGFRVFKDKDGLAENSYWPSRIGGTRGQNLPFIMSVK